MPNPRIYGVRTAGAGCRVDLATFRSERSAALGAAERDDTEASLAHATAALAEYRGEFLPQATTDWVVEVRDDLERECVDLAVAGRG